MWMSGQHKRPADEGEGQTGIVTMSGGETAVLLDRERRGLQVYSPAGYCWTPKVGQRVLVIQGRGEIPCVVGARQDGGMPDKVGVAAKQLTLDGERVNIAGRRGAGLQGERVNIAGRRGAGLQGERVDLDGEVYVNGEKLEELIARILMKLLGGG